MHKTLIESHIRNFLKFAQIRRKDIDVMIFRYLKDLEDSSSEWDKIVKTISKEMNVEPDYIYDEVKNSKMRRIRGFVTHVAKDRMKLTDIQVASLLNKSPGHIHTLKSEFLYALKNEPDMIEKLNNVNNSL